MNRIRKTVSNPKRYTDRRIYAGLALRSVVVTFILEALSRGSLLAALQFLWGRKVPFFCNALFLFASLSVSRLFGKRRWFFTNLFTLVWLFFGVINAIVLRYRMTPFSAEDFSMVPSLFRIAKNYLTPVMIAGIAAAVAALLLIIVLMWFKVPKVGYEGRFVVVLAKTSMVILGSVIITRLCINAGAISNEFENLADAYSKYGFSYCFVTSIVDVGIDKPSGYSKEMMHEIADNIREYAQEQDTENTAAGEEIRPNIIMIQLESFFDPYYLKGFRFNMDPIPCFRQIREDFQSGFLTVPVVGAGTSNTEFEILTGMSTDYFGAGEYPYNTILKERTVEALPHILSGYGYKSTAVHNNTGTFYNRHIVFSGMGFDGFVPEEYMYDLEYTHTNWAKDKALTQIMMDTLGESAQRDFIYTITVQSHGRYPQERVLSEEERVIKVTPVGGEISPDALEYYANQIYEVDQMVEALTQALEAFEEPTVLVMYGDHLPALGFGAGNLKNGNLYETEYVIWNNFGMSGEDEDLEAEQIGTRILNMFGMAGGIIPWFHNAYESDAFAGTFQTRGEYRKCFKADLAAIEYDMLYGDGWIFAEFADRIPGLILPAEEEEDRDSEGTGADALPGYWPSKILIDYKPIRVREVELDGEGSLIVRGSNFNAASRIMIDNKAKDTVFVDSRTLRLKGSAPESYSMISVGQFDENLRQLGKCVNLYRNPHLGRKPR